MKRSLLWLTALVMLPVQAFAVDHNNLDAGRPLDFDDAQSAAYREQSLEFGASLFKANGGETGVAGSIEYLDGFAPNSHLSLDFDPRYANDSGTGRRFDAGDLGIGLFHQFNRELTSTPALAVRGDLLLPTGRDSRGLDFRLRGIASKSFGQYSKLHLNLDLGLNNRPRAGERTLLPGVILGYSQPLGYPARFDRTLLAQVGIRANPDSGQKGITTFGLGLRQQVGVQSVFDIGAKSDVSGGANRESLTLVAGYSRQF